MLIRLSHSGLRTKDDTKPESEREAVQAAAVWARAREGEVEGEAEEGTVSPAQPASQSSQGGDRAGRDFPDLGQIK